MGQAGRAEDRHLRDVRVGLEDEEAVAQLLERGVDELEVATARSLASHAHRGDDHLEDQVLVLGDPGRLDQLGDAGVELVVAGAVAGPARHGQATAARP